MTIFDKAFLLATLERGIKTFCQTAAAAIVAAGVGLLDADWIGIGSLAGMAGLVSVLTSIGIGAVTGEGPSIGTLEQLPRLIDPPVERRPATDPDKD